VSLFQTLQSNGYLLIIMLEGLTEILDIVVINA
jgi:hypothetical protein